MIPQKETPMKYVGIHPDSVGFEEDFTSWSDEEKIEYVRYLERDTGQYATKIFFCLGLIIGAVITYLVIG